MGNRKRILFAGNVIQRDYLSFQFIPFIGADGKKIRHLETEICGFFYVNKQNKISLTVTQATR